LSSTARPSAPRPTGITSETEASLGSTRQSSAFTKLVSQIAPSPTASDDGSSLAALSVFVVGRFTALPSERRLGFSSFRTGVRGSIVQTRSRPATIHSGSPVRPAPV